MFMHQYLSYQENCHSTLVTDKMKLSTFFSSEEKFQTSTKNVKGMGIS